MLVDVVRLRFNGQKLPKSRVLEMSAIRGELAVKRQLARHGQHWQMVAWLNDTARIEPLIPSLIGVRLMRMLGRNFVLCGVEEVFQRKQSHCYRQAWWCRQVAS